MKKLIVILMSALPLLAVSSWGHAATLEVNWIKPEKYRDIKPGNQNRKSFQSYVFKGLEEHFSELAMKLPDDQVLKIDVTDVDLAGDVNIGGIRRIRIVTDLYFPRMKFSYQLLNNDKSIVSSGEIDLKDMGFLMNSKLKYRNKTFSHEKKMLDDWFKDTFAS